MNTDLTELRDSCDKALAKLQESISELRDSVLEESEILEEIDREINNTNLL